MPDKKLQNQIKKWFQNYNGITKGTIRELESMGFNAKKTKKHIRLISMYVDTAVYFLPCTPSDHRSGQNLGSIILRDIRIQE